MPTEDPDGGWKLRVSGDGSSAVHLLNTGAFTVYDVASGDVIIGPVAPAFDAHDVAINADGSLIAVTGGDDGQAAVYAMPDGREVGTLRGLPRPDAAY